MFHLIFVFYFVLSCFFFVLGGPGVSSLKSIRQKLDDSLLPTGPKRPVLMHVHELAIIRILFKRGQSSIFLVTIQMNEDSMCFSDVSE